ncbi:MAG: TetR/AcrR family transcriptional regulator [Actinomycetaceae bacterium]|nr:TetR/AcrR family transcriptional regulator [Actinomycetaceae bacterium]
MSKLTRPPRAEVKANILQTAAAEFLSFGYHDARIARIAAQAGYTKGALYSNFGSKPQLFTEVLLEHLKEVEVSFVPQILQIFTASTQTQTKAEQLSQLLIEHNSELVPWQVLISQLRLLAVNDPEAKEAYQNFMSVYIEMALEACAARDLLTHLPAAEKRLYVFSALQLLNTVVLETATLSNLPAEYFSRGLTAIFASILKDK